MDGISIIQVWMVIYKFVVELWPLIDGFYSMKSATVGL